MSIESVEQVERDLGFTPVDAETLKGVRLVWQKLQKLRQQSLKDDKFTTQYRELLKRSIDQARTQHPPEEAEGAVEKAKAFWDWYENLCRVGGIAERERSRGLPHQAWCEKWLPNQWKSFCEAVWRMNENPTDQFVDTAKDRANKMLKDYIGIFDG